MALIISKGLVIITIIPSAGSNGFSKIAPSRESKRAAIVKVIKAARSNFLFKLLNN